MRLNSALAAIAIASLAGCSFKTAAPPNGMQVRLKPAAPQYQEALSVMDLAPHLSVETLSSLSGFGAYLGCFIVGVGGGALPGTTQCANFAQYTAIPTTFSAQATNVNASFTMLLPISDGMTFTAFGGFPSANGSCDANPTDGGGFSFLGQTSPPASALGSVVEIPVTSTSKIGSCGTAPFQLYSDSLTGYGLGNSLTTANTGGAWTGPSGAAGLLTSAGVAGVAIPQNNNAPYYAALSAAIPASFPYVSAKATFTISSVSGNDTTVSLVGFSDSLIALSGDFIFCGLEVAAGTPGYPASGTISIVHGDDSGFSGTLGVSSLATLNPPATYTIQCDLEIPATGPIKVFAHVTGGGSTTSYSYSSPTSFTSGSIYGIIGSQESGSGSTATGTITNYSISAAEAVQE